MIRCHGDYIVAAIDAAASARQRLIRQGATPEILARIEARVRRRLKQENPELFDDHPR